MARALIILLFFSQLLNMCKKEPNLKNGESLYNNYCKSCHSAQNNNLFLKKWNTNKSVTEISKTINNGISNTEMIGFKNRLTEDEVFNLASYIIKKLNDSLDFGAANNENRKEKYQTEKQKIKVEKVFDGSDFPEFNIKVIWSIAFIDSNTFLFTERNGGFYKYKIEQKELTPIKNSLKVYSSEQGGLLEVKLHPKFYENKLVYLTYSSSSFVSSKIVLDRFVLNNDSLVFVNQIFKSDEQPKPFNNLGSRLLFGESNHLYISVGDRLNLDAPQDIYNTLGKIHRLNEDGSIPKDNPFKDENGNVLSVYTFGHRNSQGLAIQPKTNNIWAVEHGPMGGDEFNLIEKGANYGWPLASYGTNYDGSQITEKTHLEGTTQPKYYWVPSIAPGDVTFYSGKRMKVWEGDAFVTGLRAKTIIRLEVDSLNNVVHTENLLNTFARIRAIEESPDGFLYFSAEIFQDNGQIYSIMPLSPM
jgi:aldose sugar dehydrogenase